MTLQDEIKTIDLERLILIPIFAGLLFLSLIGTIRHFLFIDLSPTSLLFALHHILSLVFSVLMIVLFFRRSRATAGSDGFFPNFLAYVGTFILLLTVLAGGKTNLGPLIISAALMTAGMLFSIYSLKSLGRSFSVRPEARSLVRSGPYRLIRHPLYVGEFFGIGGSVLVGFSAWKFAIFLLWVCIQAYRSIQEERVLEVSIPEYSAYKLETKRFIPGLL